MRNHGVVTVTKGGDRNHIKGTETGTIDGGPAAPATVMEMAITVHVIKMTTENAMDRRKANRIARRTRRTMRPECTVWAGVT